MGGFLGNDTNRLAFAGGLGALAGGLGLFGGKEENPFNAEIGQLDPTMQAQLGTDIGAVRDLSGRAITGVDVGGRAAQDLATQTFGQAQDQLAGQQQGALASGLTQAGRFGADSGAAERMAGIFGKQRLAGQQQLGQRQAVNLADIASQNIAQQQKQKYGALMALPQIQQSALQTDFMAQKHMADAKNKAAAIEAGMDAQADEAQSNLFGTAGGLIGMGIGGPVGGVVGGGLGKLVGGLFG